MKSSFSTVNAVIATLAGLVVLVGYFVPGMEAVRSTVLGWASITAGFALLAGVLNLLAVHWAKVFSNENEAKGSTGSSIYSAILLLSFLVTLAVALISGPTGKWTMWIFNNIQMPVETSLLALLTITLAVASLQMLRRKPDIFTLLFLSAAILTLVTAAPVYGLGEISLLNTLHNWLTQVPAMAGVRGILMGVALGTVATGLRVLLGADRPYGG